MWFVYILQCVDGTFYAGITTDLDRRVREHNFSIKGAKYTRGRRPVHLVYFSEFPDKSLAAKEEYRIRILSREAKQRLIQTSIL